MKMKRKAILIGNTRDLAMTPCDLLNASLFLMSYQGGAWNMDEIVYMQDYSAHCILETIERTRNEENDYVIVYFTGHGGLQGGTIIEINPENELLEENSFFGLAPRQLIILDCCRDIQTSPLSIYGSSRSMSPLEMALRKEVRTEYENLAMRAAPQLVRLYSCAEGESSYSSVNGSYYSYNLIESAKELLKSSDVVTIHQCHNLASQKTANVVKKDLKMEQHPTIIPAKCLAQAGLPFCFNYESIKLKVYG